MHILRPAFDWGRDGALDFAARRGFGLGAASDGAGSTSAQSTKSGEKISDCGSAMLGCPA